MSLRSLGLSLAVLVGLMVGIVPVTQASAALATVAGATENTPAHGSTSTSVKTQSDPVPAGIIRGTVRVTAGSAAPDATLELFEVVDGAVTTNLASVASGADGTYAFTGLASGTYALRVGGLAYKSQWWNGISDDGISVPDFITVGSFGATADFVVVPYGSIVGHVESAESHFPLQDVSVCYWGEAMGECGSFLTDAEGNFVIRSLEPGAYKVQFQTPNIQGNFRGQWWPNSDTKSGAHSITVVAGEATNLGTIGLLPGAIVRGVAQSPEGGTPGMVTAALFGRDDAWGGGFNYDSPIRSVTVDADGVFSFQGLTAGPYRIRVGSSWWGGGSQAQNAPVKWIKNATDNNLGIIRTASSDSVVSGAVLDASGSPVPNASVNITPISNPMAVTPAVTDETGHFSVAVETGTYTAFVQVDGQGSYYYGSTIINSPSGYFFVSATSPKTDVNITIPGSTVVGCVVDQNSLPVSGAQVGLWPASTWNTVQFATTGDDGCYSLYGVYAGSYTLDFSKDSSDIAHTFLGGGQSFADAEFFSVGSAETVTKNASLSPGGRVTGKLTGSATLGGAYISAVSDKGVWSWFGGSSASTSSDGTFALSGLAPGTYRLAVSPPPGANWSTFYYGGKLTLVGSSTFTVASGATRALGNISTVPAQGGSVTGKITAKDTGAPLTDLVVMAINEDVTGFGKQATIQSDGTYTLSGLTPGSYTLWFSTRGGWANWNSGDGWDFNSDYISQYWGNAQNIYQAKKFTLAAGSNMRNMDMALPRGASVSGTVTALIDGEAQPLSGAAVSVLDEAGIVARGVTADDGTYSIKGLEQGAYYVRFEATDLGLGEEWYRDAVAHPTSTRDALAVGLGQAKTGIDVEMSDGAHIAGTVLAPVSQGGQPVTFAQASVVDAETGEVVATTTTDGGGRYYFDGLAEGSYKVVAKSSVYAPTWYGTDHAVGDVLDLNASDRRVDLDIQVLDGALISGVVTSSVGSHKTLPNVDVILTNTQGAAIARTTTSGAGTYSFAGLQPGSYKVRFGDSWRTGHDYISGWFGGGRTPAAAQVITLAANESRTNIDGALGQSVCTITPGPVRIAGAPYLGQTLTAKTGVWGPGTVTFTYQWQREDGETHNMIDISGATGSTYTVTETDGATRVYVLVTGYSAGCDPVVVGNSTHVMISLPPITAPATLPRIAGSAKSGSLLTATSTGWASNVTLLYQWLNDGTPIDGATARTYTPVQADIGSKISVVVSGVRTGYDGASLSSASTAAVTTADFTVSVKPSLPSTVRVGTEVTVDEGTWTPSATSFTYQWMRNGVRIVNATHATYTPVAADLAKKLTVVVTGSRDGYTSFKSTTPVGRVVAKGTFTGHPVPTITGNAVVGATLTAVLGQWVPSGTPAYQWYRNNVKIPRAIAQTLLLKAGDLNAVFRVEVTMSRAGYTSATTRSADTLPVAAYVE